MAGPVTFPESGYLYIYAGSGDFDRTGFATLVFWFFRYREGIASWFAAKKFMA